MARNSNEFKSDGIPKGLSYAYARAEDISSATDVIAAPSVSTQSIVITDIVVSILTYGVLSIQDGATEILTLNPDSKSISSISFTGPLKLTAGNALKAKLGSTNTDWSLLVTYYIEA